MEGKTGPAKSPPRLYMRMAENGKRAVVLLFMQRRRWQMWLWDLETDKFTPGQWFKGNVETSHSDLSKDGQYLILALRKDRHGGGSWKPDYHTVVSRPPYFTALAYFPCGGYDYRGGRFLKQRKVAIFSDIEVEGSRITEGCPFEIEGNAFEIANRAGEEPNRWSSELIDKKGRRFEAREGRIVQIGFDGVEEWVLLDVNGAEFESVVAPDWALRWKRR